MNISKITTFKEYVEAINTVGFSIGGSNDEGIFSLSNYFGENLESHTGNPETDPWAWRMRVIKECNNHVAYSKVFFSKSGFITKQWYPYFFKVRRNDLSFEEEFHMGTLPLHAKNIYTAIVSHGNSALHELKEYCDVAKEDKSKFERAITELQMKMYITMCGDKMKLSKTGEEYGWPSNEFCLVENFFEQTVFDIAESITVAEAVEKIRAQILLLNPDANDRDIKKFIAVRK